LPAVKPARFSRAGCPGVGGWGEFRRALPARLRHRRRRPAAAAI